MGKRVPAKKALSAGPLRGKGAKRTQAELEALTSRLAAYIAKNPGLRVEQINRDLGTSTKASADTSKPASRGRVKTGQSLQDEPSYRGGRQSCKSTCSFVRQLRGPHLSTWAWWRSRSSIAETAAASPSSLPQSSTGRFEVRSVEQRS